MRAGRRLPCTLCVVGRGNGRGTGRRAAGGGRRRHRVTREVHGNVHLWRRRGAVAVSWNCTMQCLRGKLACWSARCWASAARGSAVGAHAARAREDWAAVRGAGAAREGPRRRRGASKRVTRYAYAADAASQFPSHVTCSFTVSVVTGRFQFPHLFLQVAHALSQRGLQAVEALPDGGEGRARRARRARGAQPDAEEGARGVKLDGAHWPFHVN